MKATLKAVFLSLTLSGNLFASDSSLRMKEAMEQLSSCGNFIRYDNNSIYTGFGNYWTGSEAIRLPKPSLVRFVSLQSLTEYQVETLDSAVDLLTYNQSTYILTYSGLEEWDLGSYQRVGLYKTNIQGTPALKDQHSTSFARYKDTLIITNGISGVTFFDLKTKKITRGYGLIQSQYPLQSNAMGVTVSGKYAYVVLDSYTLVGPHDKRPFSGIVVIDMETQNVIRELGGMDPGVDSVSSDEKSLLVSFYGQPIWKYSLKALESNKLPAPTKRVWRFPTEGNPTGKAAIDEANYYTCFSRLPNPGEGPYKIKMSTTLNRKALMLD
nr:hypothetical protein BHI3_27430 [Bacteriovorax sp. HI3]